MSVAAILLALLLASAVSEGGAPSPPQSVTVPVTLDHNRLLIRVELPLQDGTRRQVRAWVDNGNPDLWIAESAARELGLQCQAKDEAPGIGGMSACKAKATAEILVGSTKLPLAGAGEATVMAASTIAAGLDAEINIPSTLLHNYDVLIDFAEKRLTLAPPGTLKFTGNPTGVLINSANGLIQVPSDLDGRKCNLGLDLGACFSLISANILESLALSHKDWPRMRGAVGVANFWGFPFEADWDLMRIRRLGFGSQVLQNVGAASLDAESLKWIRERAGTETAGLIGANALRNRRIGLAYSRGRIYLDEGATPLPFDLDVIGLVLQPGLDGGYTILGIPKFQGVAAVPEAAAGDRMISVDDVPVHGLSMGAVWQLLSGTPGESRVLVLERNGKRIQVAATVRRFLP